MWKVQRSTEDERVVLSLSGRIEGEELANLQKVLTAEAGDQDVVLDLKDVKLVDQEAVTFLACREATGTRLRNCPGYIREWIARERQQSTTRLP